jgi:uncharacterized protein (DUF2235 family)
MKRNIVVLSDGTGNAASSIWRTNVWRVFESIDLSGPDQVAFYDDGVGTSSFKPLALFGGAFGWGLKRNVIEIYKFLCRNYQPDAEIFAFGFSRGAFTIRMVVGLVTTQGLVPYYSEGDLNRKAVAAYRAFRKENFHSIHGMEIVLRWLRDKLIKVKSYVLDQQSYDKDDNTQVQSIRFVGLWDTVAAYGFPIQEMTHGISQWIWPLEFPDRKLSDKVYRARHALAIDDARTTFHPVLWTEEKEGKPVADSDGIRHIKDERISQVWFSGMHSNVGGGYPDDSLAFVPLCWLMREAQDYGLRFKYAPKADPDAFLHATSSSDKDGRLYDSRRGLGGYYRYGPRLVHNLCHARFSRRQDDTVVIDTPKIHESALQRMVNGSHAYAPIGLPARYAVVTEKGEILEGPKNSCESPEQSAGRADAQEQVWNIVWWRRIVYFLTVFASLHLLVFPLVHQTSPAEEFSTPFRFVSETVRIAGAFLPRFVTVWWLDSFAANPRTLLIGVVVVVGLIWLGAYLGGVITDKMRSIWRGDPSPDPGPIKFLNAGVYRLRTSRPYRYVMDCMKRYILPFFCALGTAYVVAALVSHAFFNVADAAGAVCKDTPEASLIDVTRATHGKRGGKVNARSRFQADKLCWASGLFLRQGVSYYITVEQEDGSKEPWLYVRYPTDLGGFDIGSHSDWRSRTWLFAAVPLRRVWLKPYARIIARVGRVGTDEYSFDPDLPRKALIESQGAPFKPRRSGELFLYLNGSVIGIPGLAKAFYHHNSGRARVIVEQR